MSVGTRVMFVPFHLIVTAGVSIMSGSADASACVALPFVPFGRANRINGEGANIIF